MVNNKNSELNMVFMGPPGVGKGTVASIIASKHSFVHLSTGSIFREEISKKSELGLKVAEIVKSGQYVPDEITSAIVKNKLYELMQQNKRVILDGYPRTTQQAQFLESMTDFKYIVISLYAPEDLILKRLSGRRFCPQCNTGYHIEYMPSKLGSKCEKCNIDLIIRSDDTIDAIQVRQKIYRNETQPLLDFYEQKGKKIDFDAAGKADDIANSIMKRLEN